MLIVYVYKDVYIFQVPYQPKIPTHHHRAHIEQFIFYIHVKSEIDFKSFGK